MKLTEGWLCRDKKDSGIDGPVMFIATELASTLVLDDGVWCAEEWNQCWEEADFARIYGLSKAPGYGKKILVDMEL